MRDETLAEQLFFVTAIVEGKGGDGSSWTGTGFVYAVQTDRGEVNFLVTNKHVFEGAVEVTLQFVSDRDGSPLFGDAVRATLTEFDAAVWHGHPNSAIDVAVLPLGLVLNLLSAGGRKPYFRAMPESNEPYADFVSQLDALERVIFIGYPSGLYDSANLTPIARQGLTATPIALDYNGLPAFLIDAAVYPGSSGSPVFLFDRGTIVDRNGNVTIGSRFYLLGVLAAVHSRIVEANVAEVADRLVAKFRDLIGLGIVFKTSTITECIDAVLSKHEIHRTAAAGISVPVAPPAEGTPADKELAGEP